MAKKEYIEGSIKGGMPPKGYSRFDDQEGVIKNRKIVHVGKNENQMI
jgi:hypothetical protein